MKAQLRKYGGVAYLAWLGVCLGVVAGFGSAALGQSVRLDLTLDSALIEKGQPISGTVTIYATGGGLFDLTVEWIDNYGRIAERLQTQVDMFGIASVPFSMDSRYALTMLNKVQASGRFVGGVAAQSVSQDFEIIPEPFDRDDYWCNVWGGGSTSNPDYFTALAQASVNLGHIYRANTYHGHEFNVRPNHDFIEDKVWFEMSGSVGAQHDTNVDNYKSHLFGGTYGTPAARQYLVRPTSLNDPASLQTLVNTIRPRMQATRKWRPVQWNISDEYGWARRANPFDYDLGPAAINQFVTWLQERYEYDIYALNEVWGTHFSSFDDLRDPINAPPGGEAALILCQEIRDREFPLNRDSGLTEARNFAPWGDFRTFMDISFAEAMRLCVQTGRAIDPTIPVGFEGAEPATPMTGYDYWRQLKEIGSIEAYDIANSPEYIRSFRYNRYGERVMSFLTLFDAGQRRNVYTIWYRLLHYGINGGPIWWYKNFFTDTSSYNLTGYANGVASTFAELQNGIVKMINMGEWDDNEVALLYSQKTIQINYMLDSEPDGKTWINRSNSWEPVNNSMFFVHVAWCKALEDIGLKGRFLSYEQLVNGELQARGVKVLILPRVMALSAEEREAIRNFAEAGGVVIADNMCGYYDGYLRRRSIADGGGWFDDFFGITRTDYHTVERYAEVGSAFSGAPAFQTPPGGFENLLDGLTTAGLYAVERGVRTTTGTPLILFDNNPDRPALIVRPYGDGKVVYMNLSMYRYGFSGNFTDERRNPASPSARNIRRLVRNLVALGGVTPKVAVKQGHDNPDGEDVFNLEKSLRIDGGIKYLTCVVNSYMDISDDDWSRRSDTPAVLFGQPGASEADITLVLAEPAHVYDVRKGQYLGYGTAINAQMKVYEGAVFALLPYRVDQLVIDSFELDEAQHATATVRVVPNDGTPGRHLLRVEVFDAQDNPMVHLKNKVVAENGLWSGVIPFAANEDLAGVKVRFTDVATGVSVEHVVNVAPPQVAAVSPEANAVIGDPDGLDQIEITFTHDVVIGPGDVTVIGAQNGSAPFNLVYDAAQAKATLQFAAPLADDAWQITVADTVHDAAGTALDGEVDTNNPALPSGDGAPGGDFVINVYKLTGDTNGDRFVDVGDVIRVVNEYGQTGQGLTGDINGDGRVDLSDLLIVVNNFGSSLP